jgi:hypothetical protein
VEDKKKLCLVYYYYYYLMLDWLQQAGPGDINLYFLGKYRAASFYSSAHARFWGNEIIFSILSSSCGLRTLLAKEGVKKAFGQLTYIPD